MQIHGDKLGTKRDGVARIVFENWDGCAPWKPRNDKILQARRFVRKIGADAYLGAETRANWDKIHHDGTLAQIFRSNTELKAVAAHNKHESDGRSQEGGTCLIVFDFLTSVTAEMGTDDTGLGRWCWARFRGKDNHTTRVISAYQPCRANKRKLRSVYEQHRRYFRSKRIRGCPRAMFKKDLITAMKEWRAEGDRLILMLDANEDLNRGPLQRKLRSELQMRDLIRERSNKAGPKTYFRGSTQIDGAFATPDVDCSGARFLPFWAGIGDHRAVVIDIPLQSLIGEQLLRVVRPPARRLQCSQEAGKRKYGQRLQQLFTEHRIPEKTRTLYAAATYPPPPNFADAAESLDTNRRQFMLHAEKTCRKRCMGEVDFSPGVIVWKKRRDVWREVVKYKQGIRINKSKLRRRARSCGIESPFSATLREAERAYDLCKREFEQLKPHAGAHRTSFIHDLIEAAEDEGDKAKARSLRAMVRRERTRKMWTSIRQAIKKRSGGSVTKVMTQVDGEWVENTSRDSVENGIMVELTKRFRLTETTPLMMGRLQEDLGYLATTPSAQAILAGTYQPPPGTDAETAGMFRIVAEVASQMRHKPIDVTITKEDFIRYWKGASEKTSSSYSNLHFGHWKAATQSEYLAELHAMFIQCICQTGTYLERWSTGLTVMLEKIAGNFRVDKLRAILLMEADFNFANKLIFGSRMMRQAEEHGVLPAENFGSRHEHCSIEISLSRLLFFDIVRQKRYSAALASVDAHTCYDRIVHNFFSLACQAFGMPIGPLAAMLLAIQLMTFHLRTAHGDSTATYGGTDEQPFQGLCQGNGASPAGWLASSAFIVKQQHAEGHKVMIRTAISLAVVAYVAFMFVDDTDLPAIATTPEETVEQVAARLQRAVTCWARSLGVTGGALKPEKCFWFSIGFRWNNGTWEYATARDTDIKVPDFSGQPRAIAHHGVHDAKEVMGVWQTPAGDMDKQMDELGQKLTSWKSNIRNGYLHRRVTWQAFWSTIWRSVAYPLPAMTMTAMQGDELLHTFYREILPCLGVNRNIHRAFRHAPPMFQGLGLPEGYLEQTIEQLSYFVMHASSATFLGNNMRASAEQLQLEVGHGTPALELSYDQFGGIATECWLKSLWKGISHFRAKIRWRHCPPLPLQRVGDSYLTVLFTNLGYDLPRLQAINRCRLHYAVYSLADITTGDGYRIRRDFIQGMHPRDVQPSPYQWPNERPSRQDKAIWIAALAAISSPSYNLRRRLGEWTRPPHRPPAWFYTPQSGRLYHHVRGSWHQYEPPHSFNLRGNNGHRRTAIQRAAPENIQPATVDILRPGTVIFTGSTTVPADPPQEPTTLEEIFAAWGEQWVWRHMQGVDDGAWIAESIQNNTLLLVCDGSYQPQLDENLGSAGWKLYCEASHRWACGALQSPGTIANAYRSELTGLYACLALTLAVCTVHQVTEGALRVCCDNEKALYLSSHKSQRVPPRRKHSDILRAIRKVRCAIPVPLTFDHVKGHQDDAVLYEDLDTASRLNVDCDLIAKNFLQASWEHNGPTPQVLPHEDITVEVEGVKVCGDVGPPLRRAYGRRLMREHLSRRGTLSSTAFNHVDWEATEKMMYNMPQQFRLWVTKHVSKFCATNKQLFRMRQAPSPACPCCDEDVQEDTRHQLHCSDPKRYELLIEGVEELEQWLTTVDTDPVLTTCICRYIRGRGHEEFGTNPPLPATYRGLAETQEEIGWDNFLEGRVSLHFRRHQKDYYQTVGSRRTALSWAAGLVERLILITHSQWIYRNSVKHHRETDGLKREERAELREHIEEQFRLGPTGLPQEDHFLLEEDFETVWQRTGADKRTWLRAIRVARDSTRTQEAPVRPAASDPDRPRRRQRTDTGYSTAAARRRTSRSRTNLGTTPRPVRRGTQLNVQTRGQKRSRSVLML